MATSDIVRKVGNTLIIKGTLDGDNLPLAPAWLGATATILIRSVGGEVAVNRAPVTLDANTRAFEYRGASLDEGAYNYEIEVTFTDDTILTWPNDGVARLSLVRGLGDL